jgi:hypothetical protein
VFYALFRVIEIEELSDAAKAIEWARGMVDDPVMRRAFADGVISAVSERAKAQEEEPSE